MAEAMPEYAKKLPKKELPNFMVKLISLFDSSAKTLIPDLEIVMQTDTTYAEELLGLKFNPAKGCISETAKSVVEIRIGLKLIHQFHSTRKYFFSKFSFAALIIVFATVSE